MRWSSELAPERIILLRRLIAFLVLLRDRSMLESDSRERRSVVDCSDVRRRRFSVADRSTTTALSLVVRRLSATTTALNGSRLHVATTAALTRESGPATCSAALPRPVRERRLHQQGDDERKIDGGVN